MLNSTLYARHKKFEEMFGQIESYTKITNVPLKFILFASPVNAYDYFDKESSEEFRIEKQYFNNGFYIGKLFREYGRKEKKEIEGRFLLFKHDKNDIYIILTHEETSFFEHGLFRYIKSKYPTFTMPFFYSWEMEEMLNGLAKTNPIYDIRLTRFSRKTRIESETSRKKKESDLTWTDLPYKEIFNQTRQSDAWIEKLSFDLIARKSDTNKPRILSGFISREGIFRCEKEFNLFYEVVVEKAIDIFFRRKKQLSNRMRKKEANYESKPFFIEFDEPIFKDRKQNSRFITLLRNLPHLAYSTVHTNPYLHMTVVDYIDNSNYEIWILSEKRITIAPQAVCSMSALNRLCDYISREFKEGIIRDFR